MGIKSSCNGAVLASGGGDGSICIWEDCSTSDEADKLKVREEEVLKQQDLMNALMKEEFDTAMKLALEMKRPGQLLKVISSLIDREGFCSSGSSSSLLVGTTSSSLKNSLKTSAMDALVSTLPPESLKLCLEYCREWNTNSRTCTASQALLNSIFRTCPPTTLSAIQGIGPLLEGLIPYTQRHYSRVDRLLRSTFLVDYVLGAMNVLLPGEEEGEDEGLVDVQNQIQNQGNAGEGGENNNNEMQVDGDDSDDGTDNEPHMNGNGINGTFDTSSSDEEDNNEDAHEMKTPVAATAVRKKNDDDADTKKKKSSTQKPSSGVFTRTRRGKETKNDSSAEKPKSGRKPPGTTARKKRRTK